MDPHHLQEKCFETLERGTWLDKNRTIGEGWLRLKSRSGEGAFIRPRLLETCMPAPQEAALPCTHISKRNTNRWVDGAMGSLWFFLSLVPPRGPSF